MTLTICMSGICNICSLLWKGKFCQWSRIGHPEQQKLSSRTLVQTGAARGAILYCCFQACSTSHIWVALPPHTETVSSLFTMACKVVTSQRATHFMFLLTSPLPQVKEMQRHGSGRVDSCKVRFNEPYLCKGPAIFYLYLWTKNC